MAVFTHSMSLAVPTVPILCPLSFPGYAWHGGPVGTDAWVLVTQGVPFAGHPFSHAWKWTAVAGWLSRDPVAAGNFDGQALLPYNSTTNVWAVNGFADDFTLYHFNGAWSPVQPMIGIKSATLIGGANPNALYCLSQDFSIDNEIRLMRWNGSTWSEDFPISIPLPPPLVGAAQWWFPNQSGFAGTVLADGVTGYVILAYGVSGNSPSGNNYAILEITSPTAAHLVAYNIPPLLAELKALWRYTDTDIWAVGDQIDPLTVSRAPYIIHGHSSSWVEHENAGYTAGDVLMMRGIGGLSPADFWICGSWQHSDSTPAQLVIDHWLGPESSGHWTRYALDYPSVIVGVDTLNQIWANSPTDAWAIGQVCSWDAAPHTIVLHWDGTGWTERNIPP